MGELDRLTGALADRYRLQGELGRGGMATVYLAQDTKHDRPVALKVLSPEVAGAVGTERFLHEIKVTARLNHPHILSVHDSGEAAGRLYFVMPYVEADSVRHVLNRERCLSLEQAIQIARQVADALAYAHAQGIIHRDVKPENILLQAGHAVVTDFGIARAVGQAAGDKLTASGIAVGTPAYMSPEQVAGEADIDGRTDIYSLGCVLFEMLSGAPPFSGPNAQATMTRRLAAAQPPSLRAAGPAVPDWVDRAVARAMARSPEERFATARAFANALAIPSGATASAGKRESVAVLPFANLSPNPENEYFSDGITEDIIVRLARIPGLKVISRTSAMQYKERTRSVRQIAQELDVATVVEGSVRRVGNHVRIVAELVDAASDQNLWAEHYDRELTDVFAIQADVAERIATALRAEISPTERSRVRAGETPEYEVYNLYVRARHFLSRYNKEGCEKGVASLEEALARDPNFAQAHAALSLAHVQRGYFGMAQAEEVIPAASSAAAQALRLDPKAADAHAAMGLLKYWYHWDWEGAAASLADAISLSPGHSFAHTTHGMLLDTLKRNEEALRERKLAFELDPLDPLCGGNVGFGYYFARRYDEAITQFKRTLEIDPSAGVAHIGLGMALVQAERFDEAMAQFQSCRNLVPGTKFMLGHLGYTYARAGRLDEARAALAGILDESGGHDVNPYDAALVLAGLGEREQALQWLDRAIDEHRPWLVWVNVAPEFDAYAGDARFETLLERMRLPS